MTKSGCVFDMYIAFILSVILVYSKCSVEFSEGPRNFSTILLYRSVLDSDKHVVVGPFWVWDSMASLALGTGGRSYEELYKALNLKRRQILQEGGHLNLMNQVLTDSEEVSLKRNAYVFVSAEFDICANFHNILSHDFETAVKLIDFDHPEAARTANTYISKTESKSLNALKSDDFLETIMIFTNVISFRGLWKLPFNKSDTTVQPFYDDNGEMIGEVNMMFQRNKFPFADIKEIGAHALELPYGKNGKYSLLILLPAPGKKSTEIYKQLAFVNVKIILERINSDTLKYGLEDINVRIPRFKISNHLLLNKPITNTANDSYQIVDDSVSVVLTIHKVDVPLASKSYRSDMQGKPLHDMDIYDIFEPGQANFSRLTEEQVFVSTIKHSAVIEVNESGTLPSVSKAVNVIGKINPPGYTANKPFIYFVVEKTTSTLILGGIYSKPSLY